MAFVFGKAKKRSSLQAQQLTPGPGNYLYLEQKAEEGFAPFNSCTFKTSEFDVALSSTGPGCYDPKCLKELQTASKRMTSSFCSKVERFKTEPREARTANQPNHMRVTLADQKQVRASTAQPKQVQSQKQEYQQAVERAREKMNLLQSANSKRRIQSIGCNKDFVRIVLSNPKNTEIMHSVYVDSSIKKKNHGPGSYNIESASQLCRKTSGKVVDWSRCTVNRFKQKKNKNPGPGAYQVLHLQKKSNSCLSASFAYQGLRSHMDEVIYKTRMPFKVKVIEEKGLRDRYPGPGQYNPRKPDGKSFHYGEDCFGSTQFPNRDQNQSSSVPGPGYYTGKEKSEDLKQRLKKNREKIFGKQKMKVQKVANLCDRNKEEVRNQCIVEMERTANKFYSLKERCSSKVGDFSHAQRWISKEDETQPGPGQYPRNEVGSEQYNAKAVHHGFNSTSYERCTFMREAANSSFYDVQRNDMGKIALRIKKNIQNLKQIDIQKAPFNSKEERFVSGKKQERVVSQGSNPQAQMVTWNTNNNEERQARYQMMKSRTEKQPQPSAAFKSTTKRSDRAAGNAAGPGDYYNPLSLEKKSFNQQYNYKAPLKIRATYRTKSSLA